MNAAKSVASLATRIAIPQKAAGREAGRTGTG